MASINGTQLTPEDGKYVCDTLISIENAYQTHLKHVSQGTSIQRDVLVQAIIVYMYTVVIMFPDFNFQQCLSAIAKTQTSQMTTLLYMVLEFKHTLASGVDMQHTALYKMLKGSQVGINTIMIMAEQKQAVQELASPGRKTLSSAKQGGGKKKQKGGYFKQSTKRAIANILMASMIVGGIFAYKNGAILVISKKIVTYFAGAFQNADHCVGNLAYGWNKISRSMPWTSGIQPSCDEIIAANNATADWIVQQTIAVMTTIKPLMLGGATGVILGWTSVQDTIIKYVIDPADNLVDFFLAKLFNIDLRQNVTLLNNFKNTTIIAKALETYELMKNNALLSSASQEQKTQFTTLIDQAAGKAARQILCFNQNTSPEAINRISPPDLLTMAKSLNITAVNPNVQDTEPCGIHTRLGEDEVDLFYRTIHNIAKEEGVKVTLEQAPAPAPASQEQPQPVGVSGMGILPPPPATTATAATAATTATTANAGGRKKKRKTMKKKHHKKRGRKTGKKKMHKKRKKHTHKHKKHHKKRGRKTGKKKH